MKRFPDRSEEQPVAALCDRDADAFAGLSSVHELGNVLDLDGHAVERLTDLVVFLPH